MKISSAIELINSLIFLPGWKFTAEDHSNRFEGSVRVRIDYPARNSNRDQAVSGYPEEIQTYASFPLIVENCDDVAVYRKIVEELVKIETHEIREFLRVSSTMWAPFHPHRIDGMHRWGDVDGDLKFGVC